jgi:ribonuclease Z
MSLRTLQLGTSWGELTVAGGSRAGEGTLILLPQLRLVLDPGRPHRSLPPMSTVCVSHGHMDHVGGLGYWASQRFLHAMGPGTVLAPRQITAELERLLELYARLEGGRPYDVQVVPVADGCTHALRPDLDLQLVATDHWVPTLGSLLRWRRRRLLPRLRGLPPRQIAARRAAGERVSLEQQVTVLAYCADTGPDLFDRHPHVLAAEVVLLECSFYERADRDRARRYGHLHLDDVLALGPRLSCRHLVLLHGSRRHRLRDIEGRIDEHLRPELECSVHHLMIDWE